MVDSNLKMAKELAEIFEEKIAYAKLLTLSHLSIFFLRNSNDLFDFLAEIRVRQLQAKLFIELKESQILSIFSIPTYFFVIWLSVEVNDMRLLTYPNFSYQAGLESNNGWLGTITLIVVSKRQ